MYQQKLILCGLMLICVSRGHNEQINYNGILRTAGEKMRHIASRHASSQPYFTDENDLFSSEIRRGSLVIEQLLANSRLYEELPQLAITEKVIQDIGVTVSPQCQNDTQFMLSSMLARENWALQMLDAFGKPDAGILRGATNWLGDYEECVAVVAINKTEYAGGFKGKYCSGSLAKPNTKPAAPGTIPTPVPMLGMCIPDTCSNTDIQLLINGLLMRFNVTSFSMQGVKCQENNLPFDSKATAAICILSIFLFFLIIGTCYDLYLRFIKSDPNMKIPTFISKNKYSSTNKTSLDESSALLNNSSVSEDNVTNSTADHIVKNNENTQTEQDTLAKIILAFSVYTNGAKILDTNQPKDSLRAVHGIRFLSMSWVILGHTFAFALVYLTDNLYPYMLTSFSRQSFSAIINALVSVDSFFTLSGLLVAYVVLTEMKKNNGRVNWFMFYFHRFWRLTPVYMMVLMIDVCLLRYIGDGPLWPQKGFELNECRDTWWTNLLYINNLVKNDHQCFGWSWYLANDMQFYVLSPLMLVLLFMSMFWGSIVLIGFLFAIWLTTGLVSRLEHIAPGPTYQMEGADTTAYMNDYYYAPYCRMGPYIAGIAAGYILYITAQKIKIRKITAMIIWFIAAGSALAIVYGLYDYANGSVATKDVGAFYNTVHRTVWGACVSWVVIACTTGYGGFVNTILSWKGFIPLSRLSYCAYLVHPLVMFSFYFSNRKPLFLYDVGMVYYYFGNMVASYAIAFIVSLAFEAPMMGLEKAIFKRDKK
ncbi:nose resistant to fluoxetine protein 6 [Patella vulgata]|uniref:nose resistant to fluoxetine protein 6 n=1 Tax=Patella vulgata TaxID=6465 RepID=UPI0021805DB4|nr:nose resistant to fluoxetine protein 6 [Patella vulgata]